MTAIISIGFKTEAFVSGGGHDSRFLPHSGA
jgi:hypothetical protein